MHHMSHPSVHATSLSRAIAESKEHCTAFKQLSRLTSLGKISYLETGAKNNDRESSTSYTALVLAFSISLLHFRF